MLTRVVDTFFYPAAALMSRLTYVRKFALATALFAVPLLLIAVESIVGHYQKIDSLDVKYQAIERLRDFNAVSQTIGQIRDDSVSVVFKPQSADASSLEQDKATVTEQLREVAALPPASRSNLLKLAIGNLETAVSRVSISASTEGDSIYSIFNDLNSFSDQAHKINVLMLTETGVLNDEDALTLSIVSLLLNDFNVPIENMGRARAFGAFFLDKGFIGSRGVLALTDVSKNLDVSYVTLKQKLEYLFQRFASADTDHAVDVALLGAIPQLLTLLQDSIILDPELAGNERDYRQQTSEQINRLFQLKDQLMQFLLTRYQQRIADLKQQQWERSLYIGILVFGCLYLFVGLFISVESSLNQLIHAARRVAEGDLSTGVALNTRDELSQLARVFEDMRQQLKQRQEELLKLTITDGLTRLYNRKHFNEYLAEHLYLAQRGQHEVGLLLIDIDFFKRLNDMYGHQAGDLCLVEMGKILQQSLERKTDAAFRFGGEEFAIVLPHTSVSGTLVMAKKVWSAIRASSLNYNDEIIGFTASIGVTSTDSLQSYDSDVLVRNADLALYKAKGKGRDCYVLQSNGKPGSHDAKVHTIHQ